MSELSLREVRIMSFLNKFQSTSLRNTKLRKNVSRHMSLVAAAAMIFSIGATIVVPASALAEDRKVEHRVPPVYPELAKRMKISGVVKVAVTVAADGSVLKAQAQGGNRMLAPAAEDAVRRWKFATGTGEATMEVDVNFQMAE
jgi:TonB family protein